MKFLRWLFPRGETYAISRALFLRGLGVIFFIAILSWWVQVDELVGSQGLTPMSEFIERVGEALDSQKRGHFSTVPSVFWINSGDVFIHVVCLTGVILAVLLAAGTVPGPALVGLWFIYLSLVNTGGAFMSFQWDILLLEAGFLGIWLAPWRRWHLAVRGKIAALTWGETAMLWIAWIVIAKLMFQSGWVKLAWATSEQPEWWPDHTALTFHYFTQPIPNPLAWSMQQLPIWFQKASLWPMYFVELVLPIFVFLGSRFRLVAALGFVALMVGIQLTGNYTYFNLLTIVLCLPLIADRYWYFLKSLPRKLRKNAKSTGSGPRPNPVTPGENWIAIAWRAPVILLLGFLNLHICLADWHRADESVPDPVLPWTHLSRDLTPDWTDALREKFYPFNLASGYGLFRTMTTTRPEIVFEGSLDGQEWREYDVRWKPDALDEAPPIVAPHQPRLAWQMWFAALEPAYHPRSRNAGWMSGLVRGLLENDPEALSFFEENPFPEQPPKFIRGALYHYEFTTREERKETGNWWKRERQGLWLPTVGKI
ncbi:MAG: lipase maturation factor family protein [Verrucomicrobiae bacterium]|nr:lipase maturation factor family protein [Verrucomicrobiae bacterium]